MNNEQIDKAVENAKAVYSDACDHTREAIDYMANVLRVDLTPVSAGTIDTPEFRDLLGRVWNSPTIGLRDKRAKPLIAHLNQRIADLRAECASVIEEHVTELRAATARIAELERAATAPVSAVPQYIPNNFTTHRGAWRDAITECINAEKARGNTDQALYWEHELAAYDRSFARLLDNPEPVRASLPPSAGAPVSAAEPKTVEFDGIADGQELPAQTEIFNAAINRNIGGSDDNVLAFAADILAMRQPQGEREYKVAGEAKPMPGTNGGFTMCVFKAIDVPSGALLFTGIERAAKQAGKETK